MNAHALLDHPWALDEVLVGHSEGFDVLRRFSVLQRKHQLGVVPFLEPDDIPEIRARLVAERRRNPAAFAAIMSILHHFVRNTAAGCEATPDPPPPGLSPSWKSSLREAIETLNSWRQPQLIIAEKRHTQWPANFVPIFFESCPGRQLNRLHAGDRLVVRLNEYSSHRHTVADFDPWLLDHLHPPGRGGPRHPCRLPKPPSLETSSFDDLNSRLPAARDAGWLVQGRYFFIPASDWNADKIPQQTWRDGRAFPRRRVPSRENPGFVDYSDRVWVWDNNHRHWDVQLGGTKYKRIRNTGQEE